MVSDYSLTIQIFPYSNGEIYLFEVRRPRKMYKYKMINFKILRLAIISSESEKVTSDKNLVLLLKGTLKQAQTALFQI